MIALGIMLIAGGRLSAQNHFGTVVYNDYVDSTIHGVGGAALKLDSLQKWVQELSGILPVTINGSLVSIPHRYAGNGSTPFRNAAQHIYNVFHRYGLNPVFENNASPYTKINVVGTLPGRRGEYVAITGHFDSANQNCPGADDNASGTAAVLEAARVLNAFPFEYTVKFIAFGGEEQGLLGSKEYIKAHATDSIRAVVNCDMIMWNGDNDDTVQVHTTTNNGPNQSQDLGEFIADVNDAYVLPTTVFIRYPGITASDHSPFWTARRSAVLLIEEYGSDFNPYYHSALDSWATSSASKHQVFFRETSRLAVASVMHLAQLSAPMPVSLVSFTAKGTDDAVLLEWRTENETNNAGFYIERSSFPSSEFSPIDFVSGAGTSALGRWYSYTDRNLAQGRYVYRLRQIDHDGTFEYSSVVTAEAGVSRNEALMLACHPNPATSAATATYALHSDERVTLTLHDVLGRRTALIEDASRNVGIHHARFSVSALSAGPYLLVLETPSGRAVTRVTVGK